jgi:hypothetical protein
MVVDDRIKQDPSYCQGVTSRLIRDMATSSGTGHNGKISRLNGNCHDTYLKARRFDSLQSLCWRRKGESPNKGMVLDKTHRPAKTLNNRAACRPERREIIVLHHHSRLDLGERLCIAKGTGKSVEDVEDLNRS